MLSCTECNFETARKSVLKVHMETHLKDPKVKVEKSPKKEIFQCPHCEKILSSKRNMEEHKHKVHFVKIVKSSQGLGVFEENP